MDILKKIFLILFSVLITLVLGEGLLQVTYYLQNGTWVWEGNAFKYEYLTRTDDRRGYTLRPAFYDEVQNIPVDVHGMRQTEQSAKLPGNTNVVVCLGDSVPFGAGVGNEDTYPYFLAGLIQQEYPHYVMNAGVPSYNFRQSFDRLHLDIYSQLSPKRVNVIVLQAANDISLLSYYRENWTPDVTWGDARFNISPIPGSNTFAVPYYISQALSQPKGKQKELDVSSRIVDIQEILFAEIEKVVEANPEVKIILLPINPFYYQTSHNEMNPSLSQWEVNHNTVNSWDTLIVEMNKMLKNVSLSFENVYYFDLIPEMDNIERDGLFVDYIHLSSQGNQVQAELIFNFMKDNNLLGNN